MMACVRMIFMNPSFAVVAGSAALDRPRFRQSTGAAVGRAPADGARAFRAGSTDGRWAAMSVVDRLGSPAERCACGLGRSASAIQRIPSAIHRALDVNDQVGAE